MSSQAFVFRPGTEGTGSVPLNPYIPGDTLNEALIAAGYGPQQAAEFETSDALIPGYGTGAGQYPTITNPANDYMLPGYGGNVGGQLFNVQSTIAPAPNQNVLATPAAPTQGQSTSHGAITQPGYGTVGPFGALGGPAPQRSIAPVSYPNPQPATQAQVVAPVSTAHAIAQHNAFLQSNSGPQNSAQANAIAQTQARAQPQLQAAGVTSLAQLI